MADTEVDIEHNRVHLPNTTDAKGRVWAQQDRLIFCASMLRAELESSDMRTRYAKELKERLNVAQAYEAEIERARERSGIKGAVNAVYDAQICMSDIAREIAELPAKALAVVMIKAKAMQRLAEVNDEGRIRASVHIGPTIAGDLIAIQPA